MTTLEIHKDIGMPALRLVYQYPYGEMEIGDSFVVPVGKRRTVTNANYRAGKRLGRRFVSRTEGDILRVWRTI
jgi:hypothetical protein